MNGPFSAIAKGGQLFIADKYNDRILIYNAIPSSNGASANLVVGQVDFTSNSTYWNGAAAPSSLNNPNGAQTDGTRFLVADQGENRVLIYNSIPTANGASANIALGQPDLVSAAPNNSSTSVTSQTLNGPYRVASDGTRFFTTDTFNNRVLIWNSLPTSDYQAANLVLGQPNLTSSASNNGGISGSTLFFRGTSMMMGPIFS